MSANEIHVGDIGTVFEVTIMDGAVAVDISTATTKALLLQKPSGAVVSKAASFKTNGIDGVLKYTTVAGDLDVSGTWSMQVLVVLPTGTWHSDTQTFVVYRNHEVST